MLIQLDYDKHMPHVAGVLVISVIALSLIIGVISTESGPVFLGGDTFTFMNAAENLIMGRGWIIDTVPARSEQPWGRYASWAPLYPFLMSFGIRAGLSPEDIMRMIMIGGFVILCISTWLIALDITRKPLIAWISAMAVATFPAILGFQFSAMPESLFVGVSLLCAYFLIRYLESNQPRDLLIVSFLLAVLTLLRYPGIVYLAATGAVLMWYRFSQRRWRRLLLELLVLGIAGIPAIGWMARNYVLGFGFTTSLHGYGSWFTQLRSLVIMLLSDWSPRLGVGIQTSMGTWLDSGWSTDQLWLALIAAIVLALVFGIVVIRRFGRNSFGATFCSWPPGMTVLAAFFLSHFIFMSYYQLVTRPFTFESRHFTVSYPFALLLLICIGHNWSRYYRTKPVLRMLPLVLLLVYLPGQIAYTANFVQTARSGVEYVHMWKNSPTGAYVRTIITDDDILYSSAGTLMWYLTRHPTRFLGFGFPTGEGPCNTLPKPMNNGQMVFGLLKWGDWDPVQEQVRREFEQ